MSREKLEDREMCRWIVTKSALYKEAGELQLY